jgi:hypothetical protein
VHGHGDDFEHIHEHSFWSLKEGCAALSRFERLRKALKSTLLLVCSTWGKEIERFVIDLRLDIKHP